MASDTLASEVSNRQKVRALTPLASMKTWWLRTLISQRHATLTRCKRSSSFFPPSAIATRLRQRRSGNFDGAKKAIFLMSRRA